MDYQYMQTLRDRLSIIDAGLILDVATGTGDFLKFASHAFRSNTGAAALEADMESLLRARNTLNGIPVILVLSSALQMPFFNGYFDTVMLSNALHHIEDHTGLFQEIKRVCKPGGLLVVNEMINERNSAMEESYMLYHQFKAEIDSQLGNYHRETYSMKDILAIIRMSGFQVVDYFLHEESIGKILDDKDVESLSVSLETLINKLKGTSYYYFYENKAREILNRIRKTGLHRPRHVAFLLKNMSGD